MAFESYYKLVKYKNLNKIPFYLENVGTAGLTLTMNTSYTDATNVEYSTDMITWSSTAPTVPVNGKLYIRANATTWNTDSDLHPRFPYGTYNVGGNIMSLLYGSSFTGNETTFPDATKTGIFRSFFRTSQYSPNTSLKSAEQLLLPATTLAEQCYFGMFAGCTALATAPALPATTLVTHCYNTMFYGCTSLIAAPALPATTLARSCYYYMFYGCTALATAPALPATTLAQSCYNAMFYGCTALTTAPALNATTLAMGCYEDMFQGCTSLNSITCLATNISATNCTNYWLSNVAANGTFTKAASMSGWTTGVNGIPSGWTVQDA